jgi:hypothetical protein
VQESLTLDYKQSDALKATDGVKKEIAKDVSAFANSAGGRIIYGIIEEGHEPKGIDSGVDPAEFTREWLEQVIMSNVAPRIEGMRIKQIPLQGGRVGYVIDIPAATSRGPHHSADKRYYKRFNFASVPMEDYEIRDVLRRSSTPDLSLKFALTVTNQDQTTSLVNAILTVNIVNRSNEPAVYSSVHIFLDADLQVSDIKNFERAGESELTYGQHLHLLKYFSRNLLPSNHQPIWRERPFLLANIPITLNPSICYVVGFDISCPGMWKQRFGTITQAKDLLMDEIKRIEPNNDDD